MKTKIIKKVIGYVGVDSGQVMICDPCYLESEWKDVKKQAKYGDPKTKGEFSYTGACTATLSKDCGGQLNYKLGHEGAGVAVSTFDGDGSYPVVAFYKEGRIHKIEIKFD